MIDEYQRQKNLLDEKFEREKPEQLPDGTVQYKIEGWKPEEYTPKNAPT